MKKYHVVKKSRMYTGVAYCGPASNYIPAEYDSIGDAFIAAKRMTGINPVGFDVYDAGTAVKVSEGVIENKFWDSLIKSS